MALFFSRQVRQLEHRVHHSFRSYTSNLQRPPPPPPTSQVVIETFSEPSRPRAYYARPAQRRDLPAEKSKWPIFLLLSMTGLSAWAAFYFFATNQERISSSIVIQVLRTVRGSEDLRDVLGDAIRPEPVWWLNGDPWIHGSIQMLRGEVDVSFRLKGSKGAGMLYFTSVRKARGEPFEILRFKVIADDGKVVHIPVKEARIAERKL